MSLCVCDLCDDATVVYKCGKCSKWTCEECGHTVTKHAGSVDRKDIWECSECEFGPVVITSDLEDTL